MATDAPQTTAEASPERHQQATELSRNIQSQFSPNDNTFKPGDHTKLNTELGGLGFPEIQIGDDNHLQDHGKDAQNVKYDNGNLTYDRTGANGENQHITVNMTDHPGLETVQNDKGQVTQTTETDAQGKQHTTDYGYDAAGKLISAAVDGKNILPPDATQAQVDVKSGQLSYLTSEGADRSTIKTTTVKPDGTVDTSVPANIQTTADGNRVWMPPGQAPITLPIDGGNDAHLDGNGHLIYTHLGDKVDVAPDGHEKTTREDGTVIERNKNGELTAYTNPNGIKLENGQWTGLPGIKGNDKPNDVHVNEDGSIDYTTPSGIKIGLDNKGQPFSYSSKDYSMYRDPSHPDDPNKWIFKQDGDHPEVPIGKPAINSDGTVTATQHTPWGDQTKKLTGGGADQPLNLDWDKMGGEFKQALEILKNPGSIMAALNTGLDNLKPVIEKLTGENFDKLLELADSLKDNPAKKALLIADNPAMGAAFGVIDIMQGIDKFKEAGRKHDDKEYVAAATQLAGGVAALTGAGAEVIAPFTGEFAPVIATAGEISNALSVVLGITSSVDEWINKKVN